MNNEAGEGSCRGLSQGTIPMFVWRDLKKLRKIKVRIAVLRVNLDPESAEYEAETPTTLPLHPVFACVTFTIWWNQYSQYRPIYLQW